MTRDEEKRVSTFFWAFVKAIKKTHFKELIDNSKTVGELTDGPFYSFSPTLKHQGDTTKGWLADVEGVGREIHAPSVYNLHFSHQDPNRIIVKSDGVSQIYCTLDSLSWTGQTQPIIDMIDQLAEWSESSEEDPSSIESKFKRFCAMGIRVDSNDMRSTVTSSFPPVPSISFIKSPFRIQVSTYNDVLCIYVSGKEVYKKGWGYYSAVWLDVLPPFSTSTAGVRIMIRTPESMFNPIELAHTDDRIKMQAQILAECYDKVLPPIVSGASPALKYALECFGEWLVHPDGFSPKR